MPDENAGKLGDPTWRRARASAAGRARTTPEYHLARIRAAVVESRAKQGLGPVITDDLTLRRVAELLNGAAGQSKKVS